jgi:hypothetical protein
VSKGKACPLQRIGIVPTDDTRNIFSPGLYCWRNHYCQSRKSPGIRGHHEDEPAHSRELYQPRSLTTGCFHAPWSTTWAPAGSDEVETLTRSPTFQTTQPTPGRRSGRIPRNVFVLPHEPLLGLPGPRGGRSMAVVAQSVEQRPVTPRVAGSSPVDRPTSLFLIVGLACNAHPQATSGGYSSEVEHDLAKVGVEGSNPFARSRLPVGASIGCGRSSGVEHVPSKLGVVGSNPTVRSIEEKSCGQS